MKIKFLINSKYQEPEILICNHQMNKEIEELGSVISQAVSQTILGYTENGVEMLAFDSIIHIYAQDQKVYAETAKGSYILHARLYELEEDFEKFRFVRISNSEIVNIRKIKRMDTSLTSTILVHLEGGIQTYASRRYVPKIKKVLGIK